MGDTDINLRIPVLETFSVQMGGAFATSSRPLSEGELTVVRSIFELSVNYLPVRIVTSTVVAAPTTLGNNIRIPPGRRLDDATLVHEMMHVWQYQNRGAGYISNSAVHQTIATVSGGSRNGAYEYTPPETNQSLSHFNAEQQAHIVEDYFVNAANERRNPGYMHILAEVRGARPLMTDMDRYMESLYGPGYQNPRMFDLPAGPDTSRSSGTVPIFRLEW